MVWRKKRKKKEPSYLLLYKPYYACVSAPAASKSRPIPLRHEQIGVNKKGFALDYRSRLLGHRVVC
jgi:hypothetical protein